MKRIFKMMIAFAVAVCVLALSSCGLSAKSAKFGLGAVPSYSAISANGEVNGKGTLDMTAAAVIIDKDGKIIDIKIDVAEDTVEYTSSGELLGLKSAATKRESNVKRTGSKLSWAAQVDIFENFCKGKTHGEITATLTPDGYGNAELVSSGCTIVLTDMAKAIEKACNAAKTCDVGGEYRLNLGAQASQSGKSVSEEADGYGKITADVAASVTDKNGRCVCAVLDSAEMSFTFDRSGASTVENGKKLLTKREQGYDYGMKKAGSKLEWFEQADAFAKICVGKTADEIKALVTSAGYGNDEVLGSGCTIHISDMAKAALKAIEQK